MVYFIITYLKCSQMPTFKKKTIPYKHFNPTIKVYCKKKKRTQWMCMLCFSERNKTCYPLSLFSIAFFIVIQKESYKSKYNKTAAVGPLVTCLDILMVK